MANPRRRRERLHRRLARLEAQKAKKKALKAPAGPTPEELAAEEERLAAEKEAALLEEKKKALLEQLAKENAASEQGVEFEIIVGNEPETGKELDVKVGEDEPKKKASSGKGKSSKKK